MEYSIIVATDSEGGIGKDGKIPWHDPEDLRYFAKITAGAGLVVGRITAESLPIKDGDRTIAIVSRSGFSFEEALQKVSHHQRIFVIGGEEIYKLADPKYIYRTRIEGKFGCDRFFHIPENYCLIQPGKYEIFVRSDEYQYINLIKRVLKAPKRSDRTGTGTLSIFGTQMRFDLRSFPLLTTKKMFFKGIVVELLWFISGSTDVKVLQEQGVHIWDGNVRNGELGPIYGYQWRKYGGQYDQLAECIRLIREDPTSRRIILNSWNPLDIDKMALPPCHVLVQFYVADGKLSSQLYQRSGDIGLGIPFNIASYALLTMIIAKICDLQPGEFIHTIGDAHIYLDHVEALTEQCQRQILQPPNIEFPKRELHEYTVDDFKLVDYKHHPSIKMNLSI